jgi:hypothetical protein
MKKGGVDVITQFRTKLVLAAVSGALVSLFGNEIVYEWIPESNEWLGWLFQYGLTGALFAIAVLWPYLKRDRSFYFRGAALIASSVLSYWCATETAAGSTWPGLLSWRWDFAGDAWITASFIGVAIVMLAVKLIIPMRWSLVYLLLGLLASVPGGLVFVWFYEDSWPGDMIPYALWHSIVCAAIHFGSLSTEGGIRLNTVLMPKFKMPIIALSALLLLFFVDAVFFMHVSWYP